MSHMPHYFITNIANTFITLQDSSRSEHGGSDILIIENTTHTF